MKLKLAVLSSLLLASGAALAQATPDYTLSYNVGLVTDYRYRGISQSRLKPALQGGVDFAHKSGFYLGTWLSTIRWVKDSGATKGSVEWDFYGGFKGELAKGWGYDLGALYYHYLDNNLGPLPGFVNPNTTELYGAVTYGPATLKYSHGITEIFGFPNSSGSGYLDLSATFDLGSGWGITPHIGHQKVRNNSPASYTDYSVTVAKDIGNGFSATAALVGTDANRNVYFTPSGKFTGKTGLVLGLKYAM
jgi:uncharacterized protein (TIGR02001 family)